MKTSTTGAAAVARAVAVSALLCAGCGGSDEAAEGTGAPVDAGSAATVRQYMTKIPTGNGPTDEATRDASVDAIVRACHAFAPRSHDGSFRANHCFAHLAASIGKESSYRSDVIVADSYGKRTVGRARANDPTVGLLQIRFSSTVHDFVSHGRRDALESTGCALPEGLAAHAKEAGDSTFWAVTGPSAHMDFMQRVACNVALGAWYYYYNATANGDPASTTYLAPYCQGKGTGGNLVTGLLSHLGGPSRGRGVVADMRAVDALKTKDGNAHRYVTTIKGWFDAMVGPSSGTHPFFVRFSPNPAQYCEL